MMETSELASRENCETSCVVCGTETNITQSGHPWRFGPACSVCFESASLELQRFVHEGVYMTDLHTALPPDNIKIRPDWKDRAWQMFHSLGQVVKNRRPIRVLSLFDGIGTGLLVLDSLGVEVQDYFSCEIDQCAMAVTKFHFYGRVQQLGCVATLTKHKLMLLGQIDLLIGGSPCNQLSLANPRRKGLFDANETGILFFEFARVLGLLQELNAGTANHLFWLYENVSSMPKSFRDTISGTLMSDPAEWDAIKYLPMKRARLFWGNVPGLHEQCRGNEDPLTLDQILEPYRRAHVASLPTITTTFHSQMTGKQMDLPVIEDGEETGLFITERERLFGFPPHFTDGPDLTINQRQQLLGKAWSVPVVKNILSPLTKFFSVTKVNEYSGAQY